MIAQAKTHQKMDQKSNKSEHSKRQMDLLPDSVCPGQLSSGQGSIVHTTPLELQPKSGSNGEMSMAAVQEALRATSEAVRDLDSFISTSKSST